MGNNGQFPLRENRNCIGGTNVKYKNTRTGAIIDSPCKISGGNWIELKEEEEVQVEEVNDVEDKNKIDEENIEVEEQGEVEEEKEAEDFDGITKKQIMQELDAFGIEYNPRAKKQELYDLMMQGR